MKKAWAYYNDNDPYCCEWARNLIRAGLIMDGDVDCRPIQEIDPNDLTSYKQCHFFCGYAGWALALRAAGFPDDRECWTGSAPCQPFSVAGGRKGFDDERDLWPHFHRLICARHPRLLLGEQVGLKAGGLWLDRVESDLEEEGYLVWSSEVPAASVNSPQRRNRIYWWAGADRRMEGTNRERWPSSVSQEPDEKCGVDPISASGNRLGRLVRPYRPRRQQVSRRPSRDEVPHGGREEGDHVPSGHGETVDGLADCRRERREEIRAESTTYQSSSDIHDKRCGKGRDRDSGNTGRSDIDRLEHSLHPKRRTGAQGWDESDRHNTGWEEAASGHQPSNPWNPWSDYTLAGPDPKGRYRRVGLKEERDARLEPGLHSVADAGGASMEEGDGLRPDLGPDEVGGDGVTPSGWPTTSARDWHGAKASDATHARNARPLNEVAERVGAVGAMEAIPLLSRGTDQRVAKLSSLGNGLCVFLAQVFVQAYMDIMVTNGKED